MEFNPQTQMQLVADDVSKVREIDIYRLFDDCPKEHREALANYLITHRSDLEGEINTVIQELKNSNS